MTIQLNLAPHQLAFLESEVRSGRFHSQAEVLSVAIDTMAQRDEARKLQELRDAIQIGLDDSERDDVVELDPVEVLARIRARS